MLTNLGAVMYRKALNSGCHLLISERTIPDSYPMTLLFKEGTGGRYEHDELGSGWLECHFLIGCHDEIHVAVEVK
jgi:hypothetical protein